MGVELQKPEGGLLLEAISNLVVGIYANHVGRGPTKARAFINDDVVVCLMEDTLTQAERTLVESGRAAAVADVRAALRETMRDEMVGGIEGLTGRRVLALNSAADLGPDVMSDLFLLGARLEADSAEGA